MLLRRICTAQIDPTQDACPTKVDQCGLKQLPPIKTEMRIMHTRDGSVSSSERSRSSSANRQSTCPYVWDFSPGQAVGDCIGLGF